MDQSPPNTDPSPIPYYTPYHCPICNSEEISYEEPVWSRRDVIGYDSDGTLIIDGLASTNYDEVDPKVEPPYLFCRECGTSMPVPEKLDFI